MTNNEDFDDNLDTAEVAEEFEEQKKAPAKKKSGGGFMFIVVLLILLGGGYYFLQMTGMQLPFAIPGLTPAAPAQVAQVDTPAATAPAPAPAPTPAAAPAPAPVGDYAQSALPPAISAGEETAVVAAQNPDMMPADPFADAASADPFAVTQADVPAAAPSGLDAAGAAVAAPADVSGTDTLAMEPPPAVQAADAVATPILAPADPFAVPAANADAAAAPVQTASPAPMADVATPVSAAAPAVQGDDRIRALEGRIETLEKTLADIQSSQITKADLENLRNSLVASVAAKTPEPVKTSDSKAVSDAEHEVGNYRQGIMPEVVKAKPAITTEDRVIAKPVAPVKKTSLAWKLKSAKPGVAWVSEGGSNEMRTVSVGDTLTGIGKVTDISMDATGKWVVTGTKGKISQ